MFKTKIKPEDLSKKYKEELPTEEGYYYVALLDSSYQWEDIDPTYEEIIMLCSGQYEMEDDDDKIFNSSDWWYCDFYLSDIGMRSLVKGYRRCLVGDKVKPMDE